MSQGTAAGLAIKSPSGGLLLFVQGTGGTFNLANTSNNVSTFAASVGSGTINLFDNGNLSIGAVSSLLGVTAGTLNPRASRAARP